MSDCHEGCIYYNYERDTNAAWCDQEEKHGKEIKDEWWDGDERCPHFDDGEREYDI